jgi:hypothetical protein
MPHQRIVFSRFHVQPFFFDDDNNDDGAVETRGEVCDKTNVEEFAPGAAARLALNTSRWIRRQARVRIEIVNAMNYFSSIGGGWASVRHTVNAGLCARVLYDLAALIGDEQTMRKCVCFGALHLQWRGDRSAFDAFCKAQRDAKSHHDAENEARAEHGMRYMLWEFGGELAKTRTKASKKRLLKSSSATEEKRS